MINYEGAYDQEVFPHVGCRGPQLDFFVAAEAKNLIDLNRIILCVEVAINLEDGKTKAKPGDVDVVFSNNTLHTLFSHAELYLNEKLISHSNNCYLHSAFVETELSTDTESKDSWAECQGYHYLAKSSGKDQQFNKLAASFAEKKECKVQLCGALHLDFLECEKFLLPNVTLHVRLYRSPNNTVLHLKGTDDDAKNLDGKILPVVEKASLFVRKVVVTDSVKLSIERALLKSEAIYPYIESLNKSFIIQAGQNCFIKENIFGTEPIRRLTLCMVKNSLFRSTPLNETPFSYQKFNLQRVEIQRGNGVPLAGTPLDTTNNVRLYYNTITALGFKEKSNGIKLEDYEDNHFFLVFDLTSTEEASKNFTLFPELTGSSLTLKLYFEKALDDAIELFLIGERFSQVTIDSARNIKKNRPYDG